MPVALKEVLSTAYELPFLLVHISVFVFLLRRRRKNSKLSTAFFDIYLMRCVVQYFAYMIVSLSHADSRASVGLVHDYFRALHGAFLFWSKSMK